LSGRNFETRTYEESIVEESFSKLRSGILNYMNETHFKQLVMIFRSAGFVERSMIRSQNAINFAYILYLTMKKQKEKPAVIESLVRKWFVLSILTSRYSASPESQFDFDIRRIQESGAQVYIKNVINAELSDAFWNFGLPQQMDTSVASSPSFNVFLAAQVKMVDKGFLSRDITVSDLVTHKGDIHHIFPRAYLKKFGLQRGRYNQIANYVITQSEINIAIRDKSPSQYMKEVFDQCNGGGLKYGGITSKQDLLENMKMNCIPEGIEEMKIDEYDLFLNKRRELMAQKIKTYFQSL
jgi:hypothetical protein